jgi:hypothetical protein
MPAHGIPSLDPLDEHIASLCRIVAQTSWLPNRETVRALGHAIFPTRRARKGHARMTLVQENGYDIGMYDDNTTPTWALLWAHGFTGGKRRGWAFIHVWPATNDINAYTHLANLAMVPECLASLTDKDGPAARYLRWHAWSVYGWKPSDQKIPARPIGYREVRWRYLQKIDDPRGLIRYRICSLNNERIRLLRGIMCGKRNKGAAR